MNKPPFCAQLADYILSGHAYLHVPTIEKTRFITELKTLAEALHKGGRRVFVWSHATGWRDVDGNLPSIPSGGQFDQPDPRKVAQEIIDLPEESIHVLRRLQYERKTGLDPALAADLGTHGARTSPLGLPRRFSCRSLVPLRSCCIISFRTSGSGRT